jgi:UDP-glucuronate 4-epimerase
VLLTGVAGFIGSSLCDKLIARGDSVVGLDNFDDFYSPAIKRQNVELLRNHSRFTLIEGDIRDTALLSSLLKNHRIDKIVHLAARAGVRPSIKDPGLYVDVNVRGTLSVLEAMKETDVKNLVFASSSSVYGNSNHVPFSESQIVDFPISPYAATKKAAELLCYNYHHLYGFNINCLRFFTVYGPRQRPEMAIHKFFRQILSGNKIVLYGDGGTSRDYTYIDDIIDGTLAALDRLEGFDLFNLGGSHPHKLIELVRMIENVCDTKATIEFLPQQPGDVEITFADITHAGKKLNYFPKVSLEKGLTFFRAWYGERK